MGYYSAIMIATTKKGFEKIKKDQEKFQEESILNYFEIEEYEKNGKQYVFIETEEMIKYYKEYEEVKQLEKSLSKLKDGYVFCKLGEENGDIEFRNKAHNRDLLDKFDFIIDLKNQLNRELEEEEEEEFE